MCTGRNRWARAKGRPSGPRVGVRRGFTLLELMLAVGILAAVMAVSFLTFGVLTRAWRRGSALGDSLHRGDFVLDQLVMGMRSMYFAERGSEGTYGFTLEDHGDGPESSDRISWVKIGGALVGQESPLAEAPHRVVFAVEDDAQGNPVAAVRAWRLFGQDTDFDPDRDVEPIYLSRRIVGFNCRVAKPMRSSPEEREIEWLDEWEYSNTVPTAVELTLYLEPLDRGEDPLPIRRVIGIPVAKYAWTRPAARSAPRPPAGSEPTPSTSAPAAPGARPRVSVPPVSAGGAPAGLAPRIGPGAPALPPSEPPAAPVESPSGRGAPR